MRFDLFYADGHHIECRWPTGLHGVLRPQLGRDRRPKAILISECSEILEAEAVKMAIHKVDPIDGFVEVVE